jgi:hypothetical protein
MRIVALRQEALYRGYRIEGTKKGECISLHVIATKPHLHSLDYSHFLALPHCKWPKAVEVVCNYIDQSFAHVRSVPQNKRKAEVEEQLPAVPTGARVHRVGRTR